MVDLDENHERELRRLADELPMLRLLPAAWAEAETVLGRLPASSHPGAVIDELSRVTFEARVNRQFTGGRATESIPPTKQTSVLPATGIICGGLLFVVGGLLGGGVVLIGVALLSLFIFAIAFAGSRVAHRAKDQVADGPVEDPPEAMPDSFGAALRLAVEHLDA